MVKTKESEFQAAYLDGKLTTNQLFQLDLIERELIDKRTELESLHIDIDEKILDKKEDPLSDFMFIAWKATDDVIKRIKEIKKFEA